MLNFFKRIKKWFFFGVTHINKRRCEIGNFWKRWYFAVLKSRKRWVKKKKIKIKKRPEYTRPSENNVLKMILRSSKIVTDDTTRSLKSTSENNVLRMILRSSKVTKTLKNSEKCIKDVLNDPEENLYKDNALKQNIFIHKKLIKLNRTKRNKYLYTKSHIIGSQFDIYRLLSDSCRNLVTTFFSTNLRHKTCEFCHHEKKLIERSHCHFNQGTRSELLRFVINRIWKSPNRKIPIKSLFFNFIQAHKNRPLYFLCRKCHRNYDTL